MKTNFFLLVLLLVVAGSFTVQAQQYVEPTNYSTDKSYSPLYLNGTANAYSIGMGGTSLGGNVSANDIYGNPARLINSGGGVAFNYLPLSSNIYMANIAMSGNPFQGYSNSPSRVTYFLAGEAKTAGTVTVTPFAPKLIAGTNQPTSGAVSKVQMDQMLTIGMAFPLNEDNSWSMAVAGKYIHSQLPNGYDTGDYYDIATACAVDISAFYNGQDSVGKGMVYGFKLANVAIGNSMLRYSADNAHYLPTMVSIAAAYTMVHNKHSILFAVDFGKEFTATAPDPNDPAAVQHYQQLGTLKSMFNPNDRVAFSGGIGYTLHTSEENDLSIRGGYAKNSYYSAPSVGAGFSHNHVHVNLSYLFSNKNNPLTQTFQLGVVFY